MSTPARFPEDEHDSHCRALAARMAKAVAGEPEEDVAVAAMSLCALSIARFAVSPDDARSGARAISRDLLRQIDRIWKETHGEEGAGSA